MTPAIHLSKRESEVSALRADGLRIKQIAERLGLSPNTVTAYLRTTYRKLGVSNAAQLANRLRSIATTPIESVRYALGEETNEQH